MIFIQVFLRDQATAEVSDELVTLRDKHQVFYITTKGESGEIVKTIIPHSNVSQIRVFEDADE